MPDDSKNYGWVSIHRSILSSPLWQDKPFARGQAWIDLILLAGYKDTKRLVNGEFRLLKRGELFTSNRTLMERWGWSNRRVERFLKVLEADGAIALKSDTKGTTIKIVNYQQYQEKSGATFYRSDTKSDAEATPERHRSDAEATQKRRRSDEYNKVNKENQENNAKIRENNVLTHGNSLTGNSSDDDPDDEFDPAEFGAMEWTSPEQLQKQLESENSDGNI